MKRERIKIKNHKISSGALSVAAAAIILVPSTIYGFGKLNANVEPSYQPEETEQIQETTVEEEAVTEPAETEETVEETTDVKHPTGIEPTGKYANTVYINYDASDEEVKNMKSEFGWLPDGLVYNDEGPYCGKFKNENMGGMTPVFMKVPKDRIKETLRFSDHFEQYETDDKIIMINYRQSYDEAAADTNNFGREVWIAFKGQPYAEQLYFTDDISNDDLKMIAENLYLVETDEPVCEWFKQEESYGSEWNSENGNPYDIEYDSEIAKFYKIGDTFLNEKLRDYGEDAPEITVNSAWIQDNFDGISTDGVGDYRDYSNFTNENGNIIPATREWVRNGDGIDTLDEVIHTEEVNRHILVLDVTLKNYRDVPMDDVCISPMLYGDAGGSFSFWTGSQSSKNNVCIGAGESTNVKLAFEIYDEDIGNLYCIVQPTNDGNNNFNSSPIVDLCGVKPEN